MLLTSIANKLNQILHTYLGFEEQNVNRHSIKVTNNDVLISSSEPHKRHVFMETWDSFISDDFKKITKEDKEKIGIAAGKALAKNLVISFEDTDIIEAS